MFHYKNVSFNKRPLKSKHVVVLEIFFRFFLTNFMDYNMNKRKTASLRTDNTFGVIETVKGRGDVFVEFLPSIWLRPNKKNGQIKVRESAKCYYPRHMHDQTREEYLMFLRNAKFECLQPAKNKKWDLLDCRVLKVDIGNVYNFKVMLGRLNRFSFRVVRRGCKR